MTVSRSLQSILFTTALVIAASAIPWAQGQSPAPARGRGIQTDLDHPILAIGSPAPDFSLPGVDGKVHTLREYAGAKVLGIVFECNHCPTSQLYESRLEKLYDDYKAKGFALVSINPNNPKSVRFDELGYTDSSDSLAEMKVRAGFRHFKWPYLYDGETQAVATKFGVVATPHIYLFDQQRKLQYQGRIDDNQRQDLVKSQDARMALDAMFAGTPVPVTTTKAFGCTTKWMSKATGVEQEMEKIAATPVTLGAATIDDVKKLRANGTDKPMLVYVWSPASSTCVSQLPDVMATYWMYHKERGFDAVTIAEAPDGQQQAALDALKKHHLAGPNMHFTGDHASLQSALGVTWKAGAPLTLVVGPDGKLLYQKEGPANIVQARRVILVNLPDTRGYIGQQAYWTAAVNPQKK
jgi:thiol-disulfide isomerase/thioredoxin